MHEPDTTSCSLCGLPTPDPPRSADDVDGSFCCQGCLSIQRALGAGEFDADDLTRPADPPMEDVNGESCFLSIEGMHCTTCESFLNARGRSVPGIHRVEASYATDTARVEYDPEQIDVDEVAGSLSGYGYRASKRQPGDRPSPRGDAWTTFLVGGGLFGMMVMVWYALFLYPMYFGFEPVAAFGGLDGLYVAANIWLFSSFVLFYTGWPILRGAIVSLAARTPNMDLLISIAAVSAYGYSTLAMVMGRSDLYFDVSVAIILVVTAGSYYEARIKRRAIGELPLDVFQGASSVTRPDGTTVPTDALDAGDAILVRPGERVPLDGTIQEGEAAVDTAVLTGEPVPETLGPGDAVPGGAVVTDNPVVVEIDDGASTQERLLASLWSVQSERPGVQRLADRLATVFVPLVVLLAIGSAVSALVIGGDGNQALLVGLTVLIVACPCALGLATPLAIAAGVRDGLHRGILVVRSSIVEEAPSVATVVLDKTGTLTAGRMVVRSIDGDDPDRLLSRAAAVERYSRHPIAESIRNHVRTDRIQPDGGTIDTAFIETTRRGVVAPIAGERTAVGHPAMLRERGFSIDAALADRIEAVRSAGDIPVAVGWDERIRGVIAVGDEPRPDWRAAIDRLATDRDVVVLTGDDGPAVERFRDDPAIDAVFAGVPPDAKRATIERLRERGPVAMVGDGSNDAPALAAADVGIAVTGATALATDAADAVVSANDLTAVADLFDVVSGTNRRLKQNLAWAFLYNGVAIPLAIAGLLNPLFAAAAMASSSMLVVVNSTRSVLRR